MYENYNYIVLLQGGGGGRCTAREYNRTSGWYYQLRTKVLRCTANCNTMKSELTLKLSCSGYSSLTLHSVKQNIKKCLQGVYVKHLNYKH